MKNFKFGLMDYIIALFLIAPFVFLAMKWNAFPDRVATHFDSDGNPNGYMGKAVGMLAVPLVNLFVVLLITFLPRIDPRRKNMEMSLHTLNIVKLMVVMILTYGFIDIVSYNLGYKLNLAKSINYILPCFFIVLGNYMSNLRSNFFIGIRTPWTLSNEEVWKKTHRIGGRLWVFCSFIYLVIYIIFGLPEWALPVLIGVISIIPMAYSFILYKKLDHKSESV